MRRRLRSTRSNFLRARGFMGLFKKLASAFGWLKHEVRILVIGLDNSGKTTLVNIIKPKKVMFGLRS